MDKDDARKQSRQVLQEMRMQVIRLYRKDIDVMQIGEQTGLIWSGVNAAIALYECDGAAAIKPHARGKVLGSALNRPEPGFFQT